MLKNSLLALCLTLIAATAGATEPLTLYKTAFGDSPAPDWKLSPDWTYKNGLLTPKGVGDMAQTAWLEGYAFTSELRSFRFKFIPQEAGVQFDVGSRRSVSTRDKGSLCQIDDANHLLKLFGRGTYWETESEVITTTPIPALQAGHEYEVAFIRNNRILTVNLIDLADNKILGTVTQGTNSDNKSNLVCGELNQTPVIINKQGQTLFKECIVDSPVHNPKVFIMGDSITNGYGLKVPDRWGDKVRTALNGSAVLAGEDGTSSALIPGLIKGDLPAYKPEWIICNLGTNGSDKGLPKYQDDINALIDYCEKNHIKLALAVFPTTQGRQNSALRNWLRTITKVPLIRFDLALSTNHDGETIDYPTFYGNPGAHTNAVGQEVMYQQVRKDIPQLFEKN